jgi:hypothetical protein
MRNSLRNSHRLTAAIAGRLTHSWSAITSAHHHFGHDGGGATCDLGRQRNPNDTEPAQPAGFFVLWTTKTGRIDPGRDSGRGERRGPDGRLHERAGARRDAPDGYATFFSRTRGKLWTKGRHRATPEVKEILVDCDDDTVLVKVKRLGDGNVCHTGERRAFSGH